MIAVALFATSIFAGTYRPVDKDTACDVNGDCWNDSGIYLSLAVDGDGNCLAPEWVGYINWDLTSETRTWQSATLKLTSFGALTGEAPYVFELYPVSNTSWTEEPTQANPGYDAGTVLATATDDLTDNVVEFVSDDLGAYFTGKKGGQASIAVAVIDGCRVGGSTTMFFEDWEGTGGSLSGPQSVNEADLTFWTGPVVAGTPTAVEVTTFSADNTQPVNYALYAGLAALTVLGIGAVGYGYSRTR